MYIFVSFFIEMLVFRCTLHKTIRETIFVGNSKKFIYFAVSMYSIIGLIARGDIYTDIAFLVEMQK